MRKTALITGLFLVFGAITAVAQQSEWRFTARLTTLSPDLSSAMIFDTESRVKINSATPTLALEGQYFLTDVVSLSASITAARYDLDGRGGDFGHEPLGEIWVAPLTLTARYEFQLRSGFQPYLGAGLNATFFTGDDVESVLRDMAVTGLKADSSFGWVIEAGLNYDLNQAAFVNLDIKVSDLSTDLKFGHESGEIFDRATLDGSTTAIALGVGWRW